MTETMLVLKCLHDHGECTLLQTVDATDIPSGRAIASLHSLVRAGDVAKARRDGFDRFTITDAGRRKVESWLPSAASTFPEVRHVG